MSAQVLQLQCDSGFYSNVHQDSEETLQPCAPSYLYLWLGNVLLAAFASAFFISNQLQLRWLVAILPAAVLLVAVAVVRWGSCSQRKASMWRSEDVRQSLMEEDNGSEAEVPGGHERESNALSELVDAGGLRGSIEGLSTPQDQRQVGSVTGNEGSDSDGEETADARRGTDVLLCSVCGDAAALPPAEEHLAPL